MSRRSHSGRSWWQDCQQDIRVSHDFSSSSTVCPARKIGRKHNRSGTVTFRVFKEMLGHPKDAVPIRPVKRLMESQATPKDAGVHMRRAFGFGNTSDFDRSLLHGDFRNDVPKDYPAGFGRHPHRGVETIACVLSGTVQHGDSNGQSRPVGALRCRNCRNPVD
jgi:hypothetical protein